MAGNITKSAHVLDFQHYCNRDWTMSLMLFQAAASTLKTLKVEVCEQMTCKLEGAISMSVER